MGGAPLLLLSSASCRLPWPGPRRSRSPAAARQRSSQARLDATLLRAGWSSGKAHD